MENYSYEEFYDELWETISEKIVSDRFIEKNRDLVRETTYDLYRLYDKSYGKFNIKLASKVTECFFKNYQTFGLNCEDVSEDKSEAYDSFYGN